MSGHTRMQGYTEDVEMHQIYPSYMNTRTTHMTFLQSLFDLPEDRLREFAGATSYCYYLETCFQPLLADEYACIWGAAGMQRPTEVRQCWHLFSSICATIQSLEDKDSSIEDVWNRVCQATDPANRGERSCGYVAVFSALCCATMTLEPRITSIDFKNSPHLMANRQPQEDGLPMSFARRPITAVFRQFHLAMLSTRWRAPIGESKANNPAVLEASCLNYASLHRIAKIRLEWVNDSASHLDFDANKRTLSIFRFPSFCALSTLTETPASTVFERVARALSGIDAEANKEPLGITQIHQEILMSYRLLFGQDASSRGLVKVALTTLREKQPDTYDTFLDTVCVHKISRKIRNLPLSLWPVTCRSFEGQLQEESAYSSQDDFPMFGARLAKLQEFALRQHPSKLRDLWRDRMNPLQWYTFWAVLIFGGGSLFLGLLQLLVAVVQLILGITQPCKC